MFDPNAGMWTMVQEARDSQASAAETFYCIDCEPIDVAIDAYEEPAPATVREGRAA